MTIFVISVLDYIRMHILRYLKPQLEVKINPCTPQNHSKNMHSPSVSIPCDGVRTPDYSTQPSDSTFTGQRFMIRRTIMSQRDGDSEKTA